MNSSLAQFYEEQGEKCEKSLFWGIYGIIVFTIGFSSNGSILLNIFYNDELRVSTNKFVIAMVSASLTGCIIDLPLLIIKNFSCGRMILSPFACKFNAFSFLLVGEIEFLLLVALSYENYCVINNCHSNKRKMGQYLSRQKIKILLISLMTLSTIFWSALPLFKIWSYYSLDENVGHCYWEMRETSINVRSFLIAFGIYHLIFSICLFYYNTKLILFVKNLQMFTRTFQNPNVTLEYLLFQRKVIIKCVIITGLYLSFWLLHGYSIIYSTVFASKFDMPEMSYFFQIACRLSYIWTPLLAVVYDRRFQVKKPLYRILSTRSSRSEGTTSSELMNRDNYHFNLIA